MKKLVYLFVIIPLFLSGCKSDSLNSLKGTLWVYSMQNADISVTQSLSFVTSSDMTQDNILTQNGESVTTSLKGTYIYNANAGKVTFTIGKEVSEGTIVANQLTVKGATVTLVYQKK